MPFQYALPAPNLGVQPTAMVPVQPSWVGPYYANDGSHVWHRSDEGPAVQYARDSGAKGTFVPPMPIDPNGPPPGLGPLWLRRSVDFGGANVGAWHVVCSAPSYGLPPYAAQRMWHCSRGVPYPPVPPTSPSFGVSGFHVGDVPQLAPMGTKALPRIPWSPPWFPPPQAQAEFPSVYGTYTFEIQAWDTRDWKTVGSVSGVAHVPYVPSSSGSPSMPSPGMTIPPDVFGLFCTKLHSLGLRGDPLLRVFVKLPPLPPTGSPNTSWPQTIQFLFPTHLSQILSNCMNNGF